MANLSTALSERLEDGGTEAVIEHLEHFIKHSHDSSIQRISDEIEKFFRSEKCKLENFIKIEQDKLDICAYESKELLKAKNICVNESNVTFEQLAEAGRKQIKRKKAALESIEKHWGQELIDHYQWNTQRAHFLEGLSSIARRRLDWRVEVAPLFNRLILEDLDIGAWGRDGYPPNRPIKQAHVTRVLDHLKSEERKKKQSVVPGYSKNVTVIPLQEEGLAGAEKVKNVRFQLDTHNLLIARTFPNTTVPPDHDDMTYPSETMWCDADQELTEAAVASDTDAFLVGPSEISPTTQRASPTPDLSADHASTEGPLNPPQDECETELRQEHSESVPGVRQSSAPDEAGEGRKNAVLEEVRNLRRELLSVVEKVKDIDRQD